MTVTQKESTHELGNLSIGLDTRNEYKVRRVSEGVDSPTMRVPMRRDE